MSTLLLQSCSASKQEVSEPTPAFELYSGYFYKILKKSIRNGEFRSETDISILSAKHGIIDTSTEIEYYDQQMTTSRARELNQSVIGAVTDRVHEEGYSRVVINMGAPYRETLSGVTAHIDAVIAEIPGGGIGEKGNALYRFIRGDDSAVKVVDDL